MRSYARQALALIASFFALAPQPVLAAAPPNDDCSSPTPISGAANWNLDDLITATLSTIPPPLNPVVQKDVWFCWTATWNGSATIDTSGGLLYSEVYAGCGCPTTGIGPVAITDPVSATAGFQVQCGHQYLVRIGAESYPFPAQNPGRDFFISKLAGKDCEPPTGNCDDCCGGKPTFNDPIYTANFTGQVAVVNQSYVGVLQNTGGQILTILNLAQLPTAVAGTVWDPVPGAPTTSFRYSQPNWDVTTLGSVFPLTLDPAGNIYTAYCSATNAPCGSSVVGSTSGTIFKIPTGSGTPQVFCNIPDNLAPPVGCNGTFVPCGQPVTCPPGIGDVCCDCSHNNQFFASAFADGRIYRITSAGLPVQAYDHATDTVGLPIREPGNSYDRYVPRGERVWAVKVHAGRLFYSVWGQELACNVNTLSPGSVPNRIWSIGLTAAGAFVPGSRRLELQVPAYPPSFANGPFDPQAASPVSDISFSNECRMMLAERAVSDNGVLVGAHDARGLEYAWDGNAWVPTFPRNGYGYPIGAAPVGLPNTNACGGCDYDASTGAAVNGRVWFTGDYLANPPLTYGITGLDPASPALATAIHIDYNDSGGFQKSKLCDVEIPCADGPCVTINDEQILCRFNSGGGYSWTFTITNNGTTPIQYILLPDPHFPNHIITLPQPLGQNQTSAAIKVNINNLLEGEVFCFDMTFADAQVSECCRIHHCITAPSCDCLQLTQSAVTCNPAQPGTYVLTFSFQNLAPNIINEMYLFPPLASTITFNPNYFSFPPVPPGGFAGPFSTVISGATPGQNFCIRFSIHRDGLECCSREFCFTMPPNCGTGTGPQPCSPFARCYADCDGSGFVNIQDFACFLNKFAAGDPCANCDMSTIAPILNVQDFACFQNAFAAGCP